MGEGGHHKFFLVNHFVNMFRGGRDPPVELTHDEGLGPVSLDMLKTSGYLSKPGASPTGEFENLFGYPLKITDNANLEFQLK